MAYKKIKVCYILPFYEEGTDTHLFYNYELIKNIAARKEFDIFVIVEKTNATNLADHEKVSRTLGVHVYIQRFKFLPMRFLELSWKCMILSWRGYRNFYVHYSYYGAIAVWLLKASEGLIHSIKIFYWNRGMPWLFKRSWFEEAVFRFILRHTVLITGPESLAKEYVKRYGVKEYRILSNWVDVGRFTPFPETHIHLPASPKLQRGELVNCFARAVALRKVLQNLRLRPMVVMPINVLFYLSTIFQKEKGRIWCRKLPEIFFMSKLSFG